MSSRKYLDMPEPWVEISVTDEDWDAADPHLLTSMFSELVLIRSFEEYVLTLAGEGLVHGPAHSSIGQEGGAVGSVLPLTTADTVNGSHRCQHQYQPKADSPDAPGGSVHAADCEREMVTVM
jgi:2-oxoisovalerate dehydrogenase E1 component